MKTRRVVFRPRAEADLVSLYDYIATASGHAVASRYLDRLEAACLSLGTLSRRGRRRDDLHPGLRTIGFERRVTIAFQVLATRVRIVRVFYGGQDLDRVLRPAGDD